MKKISLLEAFESTFHRKFAFDDFSSLHASAECTTQTIHKSELRQLTISVPSDKLKIYQRFLNSFVFDYADINREVVHSYRMGRNVYSSIEKHAANKFFFQTDILNFFAHITAADVEKIISDKLSSAPITDIERHKQTILNLVTADGKIPIGFSTSPNISNSVLLEFDNALATTCQEQEVIYTRYSDDLILSSKSQDVLRRVADQLPKLLSDCTNNNFAFNARKTKHTHLGNKVKILGLVILPTGKVTVDMRIKEAIEILLHFYVSDQGKYEDYLKTKLKGNLTRISGQLHYINTIDQDYLVKLRRKYGNYVVDYFSSGTDA